MFCAHFVSHCFQRLTIWLLRRNLLVSVHTFLYLVVPTTSTTTTATSSSSSTTPTTPTPTPTTPTTTTPTTTTTMTTTNVVERVPSLHFDATSCQVRTEQNKTILEDIEQ